MVIEFLKFQEKNLLPFLCGKGENINCCLLNDSLFLPNIKMQMSYCGLMI